MRVVHEKVFKPLWDADFKSTEIGPLWFINPIAGIATKYRHPTTQKLYADVIPKERWMDLPKAWEICKSKNGDPPASVRAAPAAISSGRRQSRVTWGCFCVIEGS